MDKYLLSVLILVFISMILSIIFIPNIKKRFSRKESSHPADNIKKYRDIANDNNQLLIHFIHIGKTAGTALKHAIGIKGRVYQNEQYLIIGQRHSFTLKDVKIGEKCFFILRDPINRFVSAFYARKRKGMPRIYNEWTRDERKAFTNFSTPNALAKSIYSKNKIERKKAVHAMRSIRHIKSSYWKWFFDKKYFLSRKDDIIFIGNQENLSEDFNKLKNTLKLPSKMKLPDDPIKMHKNPDKIDKKLDETAMKNLKLWYKKDYDFLDIVSSL